MITKNSKTERVYTSRIIKAGALLAETRILLSHWNPELSVAQNERQLVEQNLFGKSSRHWVLQIIKAMEVRYLQEPTTARALIRLVLGSLPPMVLNRILYFYIAQSDALLHDFVCETLWQRTSQNRPDITPEDGRRQMETWIKEGRILRAWNENTMARVVRELLATLRDFGVLEGKAKKRLSAFYLPLEAFAFIAFVLKENQPSGQRLLQHPEWRLFFLNDTLVERFFLEAHQHDLLEYQAAGSIVRISFPAQTLEEYADVVLNSTH